METRTFDETAKEALTALLTQFWILRENDPELFQTIRDRETALRDYVLDKLGYRLIVHRHFAKLEKVPAVPEPWMGIGTFLHGRDYALFCCLLAYLEHKGVDEQFLLSHLCEELSAMYPGEESLNWTHYEHRKSLVRVLQTSEEFGILKVVDGEIAAFHFNEESEALYEVSVASRYFMRSYPKDLFHFHSKEEILAAESGEDELTGAQRRHRVYRQLLLSPVYYRSELHEEDFDYVVRYRHRLADDLEKHTGLRMELFKQTALLVNPEKSGRDRQFPDLRAISDIALQFAGLVRDSRDEGRVVTDGEGAVRLTPVDFEQMVILCKKQFGAGWSGQYRKGLIRTVAAELLALLKEWKMARVDAETGQISLLPVLGRLCGEYPTDFTEEKRAKVDVEFAEEALDEEEEHA